MIWEVQKWDLQNHCFDRNQIIPKDVLIENKTKQSNKQEREEENHV